MMISLLAMTLASIYRGGIEAVPKGQTEAGQVLGMTKSQIFFKVTLLQVVKRILPPTVFLRHHDDLLVGDDVGQ